MFIQQRAYQYLFKSFIFDRQRANYKLARSLRHGVNVIYFMGFGLTDVIKSKILVGPRGPMNEQTNILNSDI